MTFGRVKTSCIARLLALLLIWITPIVGKAQDWLFTTNDNAITITAYIGSGGDVIVPETLSGLPVTSIYSWAFGNCTSLTNLVLPNSLLNIGPSAFHTCTNLRSVSIPNNTTNIENAAFYHCYNLTNISLGISLTSIGYGAFYSCISLPNITIPKHVTNIDGAVFRYCISLGKVTLGDDVVNIGNNAFDGCFSLTNITIPKHLTNIGADAFNYCINLENIYFNGSAPSIGDNAFNYDTNLTVYYLPETTGWGLTFGGHLTALWNPRPQTTHPSFGIRTNQFGFPITASTNLTIVVEACTNLSNPDWLPLSTNTLTNASSYFSDPQWANHRGRFYRLRSP